MFVEDHCVERKWVFVVCVLRDSTVELLLYRTVHAFICAPGGQGLGKVQTDCLSGCAPTADALACVLWSRDGDVLW